MVSDEQVVRCEPVFLEMPEWKNLTFRILFIVDIFSYMNFRTQQVRNAPMHRSATHEEIRQQKSSENRYLKTVYKSAPGDVTSKNAKPQLVQAQLPQPKSGTGQHNRYHPTASSHRTSFTTGFKSGRRKSDCC
ncbi:hypothetical protein TcasGA2_TC034519 [Tribolium castaneum]|uniref:Uncharacterized protein n=1 Tax=Tribolium castaneum TaxID=7070 RepID=A0A139WP51_TRICA|nr:hypothetical protein TcasGA2_TC034519 [Tribolium castaneum]